MDAETHELIAAYALGALDESERARVEELLAHSDEARDELRSFSEVTAALAVGVAGPEPSNGLRERILEQARAEPQVVVPFERPARRSRPIVPLLSLAAAAAVVLAIGLGAWGSSLNGKLSDTREALAAQEQAAAVLADPEASAVALAAGSGRLVVGDEGRAVLVVDGLDPAPAGQTYQVWVIDGGSPPRSAGLFRGGGGSNVVLVANGVSTGSVVAVTRERAGGAEQPTSDPLVASKPV